MLSEILENRRMLSSAAATPAVHAAEAQHPSFVTVIDNPYFPLTPGTKFMYRGVEDGEHKRDLVTVISSYTKTISGVICTVVLDRVFVGSEVQERTHDWYAQDTKGNVWYFGEDTKDFSEDTVSTEGSFKAGKNGAKPGIIMEANPMPEDLYFQEDAPGVAEDQANVLDLHAGAKTPFRNFTTDVLKIAEFTDLEPGIVEHKFYFKGIGEVKEQGVKGESAKFELVRMTST